MDVIGGSPSQTRASEQEGGRQEWHMARMGTEEQGGPVGGGQPQSLKAWSRVSNNKVVKVVKTVHGPQGTPGFFRVLSASSRTR